MNTIRKNLFPVLAALIWGTAFVAQSVGAAYVPPFAFNTVRSLIAAAALLLTDLASIRTDAIYHHVYEFGTTSIAVAIGNSREVAKRKSGELIFQKCMPLGIVMDERIASGSYFAVAFHTFQEYLKHPECLEGPPPVIHEEIRRIFHLD